MGLLSQRPLSKECNDRFAKEEKEVLVLTVGDMSAFKLRDDQYWSVSIDVLAYIDLTSGELIDKKRYLTWEATEKQALKSKKIHNIKSGKIYQLTIRESLAYENEYTHQLMEKGRSLLLVNVRKRDCHEPKLEKILAEYQKEVSIQPQGCEKLILDKLLCVFSGKGMWNQEKCYIYINSDGDGKETANDALETYNELMKHCREWDQKAREFAVKELTESANDWAEEDDEISEEDFKKRICISEVSVSQEGNFELFYDDGDMFYGHVIIVSGNIRKGIQDADIAG